MVGLIDCDNFFVSCERVIDPSLEGKPLVVLSNNDGCVVARSGEVKRMGVPMGIPFFKIRNLVDSGQILALSCNNQLYSELSHRLMLFIGENAKEQEVYSVDECFVSLVGVAQPVEFMRMLRSAIWERFHLPVSVGIAGTKTLAKVAAYYAKHFSGYRGVACIDSEAKREKALAQLPVGEVWGLGRKHQKRLEALGCVYASDFVALPQLEIPKIFSSGVLATYLELKGTRCLPFAKSKPPQSIFSSRSLPVESNDFALLREIVATFVANCHGKLRAAGGKCARIAIVLETNRFKLRAPQQHEHFEMDFERPTDDILTLTSAASRLLRLHVRPECLYKRVGVGLSQLVYTPTTISIFDTSDSDRSQRLNEALDGIRSAFGKSTITVASRNSRTMESLSRAERRSEIPGDGFPDIDKKSFPPRIPS